MGEAIKYSSLHKHLTPHHGYNAIDDFFTPDSSENSIGLIKIRNTICHKDTKNSKWKQELHLF